MHYFERIQKAIDYIEKNLTHEISLKQLAHIACYSPYHFHRLFHVLTHETIMDYIRKRRLARALDLINQNKLSLTEIAFLFQFKSLDSFSRAFKRLYGINPGQYRKQKKPFLSPQAKILIVENLNLNNYRKIMMQPKIITKNKFTILGYLLKTTALDGKNFKDITQFWQNYHKNQLESKIPNKKDQKVVLGICCDMSRDSNDFSYMIGFEVDQIPSALNGLDYRTIPASKYAVFTTPCAGEKEFVKSIQETTQFIFKQWLPQSGYQYNENSVDIEWYDSRSKGHDNLQMDIYIPIQ